MRILSDELEDRALDCAVQKALRGLISRHPLAYSTDWSLAGPIIEQAGIDIVNAENIGHEHRWMAAYPIRSGQRGDYSFGHTALVAAMRCFVAAKLGPEVEIPDELVTQEIRSRRRPP